MPNATQGEKEEVEECIASVGCYGHYGYRGHHEGCSYPLACGLNIGQLRQFSSSP
jgi:hypothetical protein